MANKEKEIIKKLLKIAENQQKIIKKLAQSQDPFYHKVDERDPNAAVYKKYDPLYSPESMVNPPASVAPKAVSVSDEMKMTYSDSGLPAGVKQLLDAAGVKPLLDGGAGAPGLLKLDFDGKNVNVRYNADLVKIRASQVKTLLQSALKGFVVMDPIGVRNPDKSTWHPNY